MVQLPLHTGKLSGTKYLHVLHVDGRLNIMVTTIMASRIGGLVEQSQGALNYRKVLIVYYLDGNCCLSSTIERNHHSVDTVGIAAGD